MPRPSKREERREEILEAYGRCVARFGVEGATLERVAEEAGLARALIRHNVGNKDEVLAAFVDFFIEQDTQETNGVFAELPEKNRLKWLIRYLFDPEYTQTEGNRISNALHTAAIDRPAVASKLNSWNQHFVECLKLELSQEFEAAAKKDIDAVAIGIASLYFNSDSWAALGDNKNIRRQSVRAVDLLLQSLGR